MSWYMAVLVRGSFVDGALDEARLGDTLFKLIEAADPESAYQRALALGEACADDYTEDDGQVVRLQCLGLADLRPIDAAEVGDGTEVYSELIPTKPSRKLVDKERLTAFETDDELDEFGDEEEEGEEGAEPHEEEEKQRFSNNSPIREG